MFTEVLGVIIIIGVLVILLLRHGSNKASDDNIRRNISPAAQHLQQELEITGNKILLQIDDRMNQLEKVINEADERMDQLKRYYAMMAEEENKRALKLDASQNTQTPRKEEKEDFNSLLNTAAKNEYGGRIDISSRSTETIPPAEKKSEPQMGENEQVLSEMSRKVFALLAQGVSPSEIGRRMSLGRGAVDMIVQMYNRK